jgi:hypothetical protein
MRLAGFDGSAVGPHPGYWRYGARTVHPDAGQACLPTDQWRSDCFGTTQPIVGDVLVGDVLGRRVTRSVAIGRSIKLRVTRPAKSRRRGPISGRDTGTTTRRGACFVAARETGLHTSQIVVRSGGRRLRMTPRSSLHDAVANLIHSNSGRTDRPAATVAESTASYQTRFSQNPAPGIILITSAAHIKAGCRET